MGCIVINFFTRRRSEVIDEPVNELTTPVLNDNVPEQVTRKIPRKRKTPEVDESVKQFFRDSLNNERVKAKYKLTPKE